MLKVWLGTKMLYWREIKTAAHPRHCRDSPEIKSRHLSPAMPLLSPALGGPGIQMTGALNMSRLMRKPTICIGKNKGADQLRGNREADESLCFHYTDSTIPLLSKSKISSL